MELPDFLSVDDGGFIHVTGRCVGLHHLLRAYNEGLPPEVIALQYPSIQLAIVHKLIAYYLEHRGEVDKYIVEHDRLIEEHVTVSPPGPTLIGLLRHLPTGNRSKDEIDAQIRAERTSWGDK